MIDVTGVTLKLNQQVHAEDLQPFDEAILACGIVPRRPPIDGIDHPKVLTYTEVLRDKAPVGKRVAIIGCGGIGFDTAMYLSQHGESTSQNIAEFCTEWELIPACNRQEVCARKAHARHVVHGKSSCCNAKPASRAKD